MDQTQKALKLLRYLPRFNESNLLMHVYKRKKPQSMRGARQPRWPAKSNEKRQRWHPIGFEQGRTPWYLRVPMERYYENFDARRQYPPMSLQQLQLQVDLGLIDTNKPVDLATICGANHFDISVPDNHYGVHLTSDGIDNFYACLNIEVQYAREPVIAAVERNGGQITTAFFDIKSVAALVDPYKFFKLDPKNRGYLADPAEVERERQKLAQKYGYEIPEIEDEAKREMLQIRKHKRQVFFGLEPGYVVNLRDREILEPLDEELREYYGLPRIVEEQAQNSQTSS